MSEEKIAVCFVDDDLSEIERFRKYLGDRFTVGAGQSIGDALADLKSRGRKKPDVFLLDMYGPEGPYDNTAEISLKEARAEYLQAEAHFHKILAQLGQTTRRGYRNVDDLRRKYPRFRIPVAFFTRKGTLANAVEAFENDPECPVLKKPDPSPDELLTAKPKGEELAKLYDRAFHARKGQIADDIERVISRFSWRAKYGDLVVGIALGVLASLAAQGIVWLVTIAIKRWC